MKEKSRNDIQELDAICNEVRVLVDSKSYSECDEYLKNILSRYPHEPEPHNLYGLLLEKQGDHLLAMKHFRAAWALDPTYLPARHNLNLYGTFFSEGKGAYVESDCPQLIEHNTCKIEYDENGIGHIVRRKR